MNSLRGDDPAQRMLAREDDAAVIDNLRWGRNAGVVFTESGPLNQCASAGGTPVGLGLDGELGVTVAANSLHGPRISGPVPIGPIRCEFLVKRTFPLGLKPQSLGASVRMA